jgi:hypothetical protein
MKTKCYSVKLKSLFSISEKAFKATAFDGSEATIPKSQVFGIDNEIQKSDAYWISVWILEQKEIQYSRKKIGWYNSETNRIEPNIEVIHHKPKKIDFNPNDNPNESLVK